MLDCASGTSGPHSPTVSFGDHRIDYAQLREDLARAVARLCPGWLSSQRDDLVQSAMMRVMQIVDRQAAWR